MNKAKTVSINSFKSLSFVVFLSLAQFSVTGHAQYLTGPVASGLGGANRAASDEGEQILSNPATIVHASVFTSSLIYIDGYADANEHDNLMGVTLTDNSEGLMFSGGYAFVKRERTFDLLPSRKEKYHQFSLGRFVLPHLSLGGTLTYLDTDIVGGESFQQLDGHLGMLYNPIPDLGFGLVFYNLGPRDRDLPLEIQNMNQISLAVHYIFMPTFRLRADISQQLEVNPDKEIRYQIGAESRFSEFFMVRLGFDKDDLADRDYYTLGIGFDGPRLKLDYFYRKNTDYSEGALHGVDMRLPFW